MNAGESGEEALAVDAEKASRSGGGDLWAVEEFFGLVEFWPGPPEWRRPALK